MTDTDQITITTTMGGVLAQYGILDRRLSVDRAETVGRGLRRGRLAGTAAATLMLGPVGLLGLAGSTAKRVQDVYALAVDDGDDYALFALADAAFGRKVAARMRTLVQQQSPSTPAVSVEGEPAIEQLERLSALKAQGVVSDREFAALKAKVLGNFAGGSPPLPITTEAGDAHSSRADMERRLRDDLQALLLKRRTDAGP